MKKIVSISFVLGLEIWALRTFSLCNFIVQKLSISSYQLSLQLLDAIHNDSGVPFFMIRLFYNKPVQFLIDAIKTYLKFFDFTFLISVVSLAGIAGILLGIWYLSRKKEKKYKSFLVVVFLSPLLKEFFHNTTLILPVIPYIILLNTLSLLGWWYFLSEKKKSKIAFSLLFLSLIVSAWWLLLFGHNPNQYCSV